MKNLYCMLPAFLLVFTFGTHRAEAQELAVSNIPESMLRGANSVVRDHERTLTLTVEGTLNHRETIKLTILNEKALEQAHLEIHYNKGDLVNIRSAAIFDASGIKIRSIRRSEMQDYSTAGELTMYSDSRAIYYRIVPVNYPFTVSFDYDITYGRMYLYRIFTPYISDYQSIIRSSFTVDNPAGVTLNIKEQRLPNTTVINRTATSANWKFLDLPPLVDEPYMPSPLEFLPLIRVASTEIDYNNIRGKADTWENYGRWLALLSAGRKHLSPSTVAHLNQLVGKTDCQREKIRILYKHLQSKTHYISISLGIGSIQPHEASQVDELGYGDCKDLSNYMVSMLEAVGIKSYYAVVNSGSGQYSFQADQPGHQFDHAIVCVPSGNDSIWLECTSQINPFGHLGGFTDNRHALLINDNSGTLVKTPGYTINDNFICSKMVIDHGLDGTAGRGSIVSSGLLMDDGVRAASMDKKDQIAWVNDRLEINDFTLVNHQFDITEDPQPRVSLSVDLAMKSYFSGANGRLFAQLNLNNSISAPARIRSRKFPLYIPFSYHTVDTLIINLPAGYKPEQLPVSSVADERFGSYSMNTVFENGSIQCIRKFELMAGSHAPEVYNAFYEFMQKAAVADARQLVLITGP